MEHARAAWHFGDGIDVMEILKLNKKFGVAGAGMLLCLAGCGMTASFSEKAGPSFPSTGSEPSGTIVFTSNEDGNWEIYSQGTADPEPRRLTRIPQEEEGAVPSPDGKKLAFVSRRDGDYEIYLMERDGSNQTRITHSKGIDEDPQWTPDGRQILFESSRAGNWDIFIMNSDGTHQINLTQTPFDEADPSLSPDGKRVLFKSQREGKWHLYIMNLDGSGLRPLARSAYTEGALDDPVWAPDGNRIAYVSKRFKNPDVYIMDLPGAEEEWNKKKASVRNLTRHSARDEGPTWSPDGRFISFVSDREGERNLYVVPSRGGEARRIGSVPVKAGPARWSSDGFWLAYVGGDEAGQSIQLVSVDGQRAKMMGWDRGEMTELQWMPFPVSDNEDELEIVQ